MPLEPGESEDAIRARLPVPAADKEQALYISEPLKQTGRTMIKDENLCVHCGLCAERCPTTAWDMQKSHLWVPYAKDELAKDELAKDQLQEAAAE